MNNAFLKSFSTLKQVYEERAFSSLALNKTLTVCKSSDRALITKLVYGVLDNDGKLSYIISKYVKKMPKGDTLIIMKMGVYCLVELSLPVYAVVNDLAELSKVTEDRRQVGFVNATLKNIAQSVKNFDDYPTEDFSRWSVEYSYPEWALKKLVKDYGRDVALQIISYQPSNCTTVRVAGDALTAATKNKFPNAAPTCFADALSVSGKLPPQDESFTLQSLSSMAISKAVANGLRGNFLDCCSAPGGKAVYVKQMCPNVDVVACDVHPHRVELIDSYAKRMGVRVETHCLDMTEYRPEWEKAFDTVLCDVPCSGFGVLDNRPDIKLFRQNIDIAELKKLQYAILCNCSNYVAVGGRLVYSTCTVFDSENGRNVTKFLKERPCFEYGTIDVVELPQTYGKATYQFLPYKDGMQGFYLAVLRRKE